MSTIISKDDYTRYTTLFTSFVNAAIVQTDGVAKEMNPVRSRFGVSTLKTKNIHIFFNENTVTIDLYVDIIYGYTVPEVVGALQERIVNSIKGASDFQIKSVNVHVSNVIFT